METGLIRTTVVDAYLDQQISRRCLRIGDEDVEVAVVVEDARVD
jgi:hypothetical protein